QAAGGEVETGGRDGAGRQFAAGRGAHRIAVAAAGEAGSPQAQADAAGLFQELSSGAHVSPPFFAGHIPDVAGTRITSRAPKRDFPCPNCCCPPPRPACWPPWWRSPSPRRSITR